MPKNELNYFTWNFKLPELEKKKKTCVNKDQNQQFSEM
jgi:hypothetical protein